MFSLTKKKSGDDSSLIAPENWSGVKKNALMFRAEPEGVFMSPPQKEFYCDNHKLKLGLISRDYYFLTGMQYILDDIRNSSLYVSNAFSLMNKHEISEFHAFICHITSYEDCLDLYRMALRLNIESCIASIFAIISDDIGDDLAGIAERHGNITLLSSHLSVYSLKRKILKGISSSSKTQKGETFFPSTLTPYQADILSMSAMGLSPADIAAKKGLRASSVYNTRKRALEKAGVNSKPMVAILYSQLNASSLCKKHHQSSKSERLLFLRNLSMHTNSSGDDTVLKHK